MRRLLLSNLAGGAVFALPMLALPTLVMAADKAEKAGAAKGGMPQLDPSSFASQIFWLAVTFIAFFLIVWRVAIPKIGRVIEERHDRIEGSLEKARELREEAEAVLAEYEAAAAEGRAKAQQVVREAAADATAKAAAEHETLGKALAKQVGEAEGRISAAKDDALTHIQEVAAELAQTVSEKLLDGKVAAKDATAAVAAALKDQS
jgi:F-type H+-transporting ATPase subunit b